MNPGFVYNYVDAFYKSADTITNSQKLVIFADIFWTNNCLCCFESVVYEVKDIFCYSRCMALFTYIHRMAVCSLNDHSIFCIKP